MLLLRGQQQAGGAQAARGSSGAAPARPLPRGGGRSGRGRCSIARPSRPSNSTGALQDMRIVPLAPEQLAAAAAEQPSQPRDAAAPGLAVPPLERWGEDPLLMSGCEPGARPLRVAVLVSGGVDSSLALQLVSAAGHAPTAFYLQIWFQEDFRNFWDACPWEEDLDYARKVCDALGVPLVVVPLTQAYWERVVAHSVAEIKAGRTPNPDLLCNSRCGGSGGGGGGGGGDEGWRSRRARVTPCTACRAARRVKFGAFLEYLEQQHAGVFDRVASGHYARLARCMFPLGGLTKPHVRALAAAAGLATSARKDSQGICFLGKVKFAEFVKQHLGEWAGPLVEEESGRVVGLHEGYWFYTVGQRGGIKLPGGPWYVTAKDMTRNVVYVSRAYYETAKQRDAFVCGPFSWLGDARPADGGASGAPLLVKVRHGPTLYPCRLTLGRRTEMLARIAGAPPPQQQREQEQQQQEQEQQQQQQQEQEQQRAADDAAGELYGLVELGENDQGLAPGQYAVFYHAGVCLGAAQILGAPRGAPAAAAARSIPAAAARVSADGSISSSRGAMALDLKAFAQRLGLDWELALGGDGAPVLDTGDDEALSCSYDGVELVVGDGGASAGAGKLFITTRRIIWLGAGAGGGCLAAGYRQVVVHAVSRGDGGGAAGASRACVYLQLDEGSDDMPGDEGEEEGEEQPSAELRLVPADADQVEAIFAKLCECSALNPDSDAEEEGGAQLFFDDAEVLAGLPDDQRAALLAARAEGALGVADDLDELMADDPERFEDDDEPASATAGGAANGHGAGAAQ
ncbi:mnmA [Scenedesmus sp. PABB004]|nr:mnmA [Scenedesmus sp. PABB004]